MDSPMKAFGLQLQLEGYVRSGQLDRIKDALLVCAGIWEDPASCPIDDVLLKQAKQALISAGWTLKVVPLRGLVISDPKGAEFNSHRNGKPKATAL